MRYVVGDLIMKIKGGKREKKYRTKSFYLYIKEFVSRSDKIITKFYLLKCRPSGPITKERLARVKGRP